MRDPGQPPVASGSARARAGGRPPAGTVLEVRWIDIRAVTLSRSELRELDAVERTRAAAFTFAADRHRYLVAHAALRRALSGQAGTPPGRLEFIRQPCPRCGGPAGRPALAGHPGVHFSLAHSGDAVAIAIASAPVGIDTERMAERCTCRLAAAMHAGDAASIRMLPEQRRHAEIMRWWVGAEAVLKCTGAGIVHGMAEFPVLTARPAAGQAALRTAGCWLLPLPAPPGYAAALGLRSAEPPAPGTLAP
jgi:4'-phosphopantetheinyl transferase